MKRIENGEFYSEINLLNVETGHVFFSKKYASITYRKASSPVIIDLDACAIVKTLFYQSFYSCISPDDKILIVHSDDKLNYHQLPNLERIISLPSREIPDKILFASNNTKFYVLTRSTKQITFFGVILEKKHFQAVSIIQDIDIFDMKLSPDENTLLVCSKKCIYVIETNTTDFNVVHRLKPNLPDCKSPELSATPSVMSRTETSLSFHNSLIDQKTRNTFNGFGITLNNQIVYATYYTYLYCWNVMDGSLLRVFQSTLAANRIKKSCSSACLDCIVSLLDDGSLVCWNLKNVDKNLNFENMLVYDSRIVDCLLPRVSSFQADTSSSLLLTYCCTSPDIKVHALKQAGSVCSVLNSYYDETRDDVLTSHVDSVTVDDTGRFCFVVLETENFAGKRMQEEDMNFVKKCGSLVDMHNQVATMEKFTYIVRKNSRFEIKAKFVNKTKIDVFLVIQITSCINDFDPFSGNEYDWTDFETSVRIYGPIQYKRDVVESERLPLFDEFKPCGEPMTNDVCLTKDFVYFSLMHQCSKLVDKSSPLTVKAKRYEVQLNVYDLFEFKKTKTPVQYFGLSEFLTSAEFSYDNVLIDAKAVFDGTILIVYSKEGIRQETNSVGIQIASNSYEYDYTCFRFERDTRTLKGAVVYDPLKNVVLKSFPCLFDSLVSVGRVLVSSDWFYAIDNVWNVYDLRTGTILNNIREIDHTLDLSLKYVQFVLNGRYILTSNSDENKVYLIRCYDSRIVASFWTYDRLSCLRVGEADRTIVAGTVNGVLFCLKILIDLERFEAISQYIGCLRNVVAFVEPVGESMTRTHQQQHHGRSLNSSMSVGGASVHTPKDILNFDLRRVIHSAHEHKRLKSRESTTRSRCSSVLSMQNSTNELEVFDDHENLVMKRRGLTALSKGIKHAPFDQTTSQACSIQ